MKNLVSGKGANNDMTAMYKGLRTNLPKEIMAYNIDNRFDTCLPSYLTCMDVDKYLQDFTMKHQLNDVIKFSTKVLDCIPVPVDQVVNKMPTWTIKFQSVLTGEIEYKPVDYIFVCNGHYSEEFVPKDVENLETYRGIQMHAKEYDEPTYFQGLRVLVVGARSSATDIARELSLCSTVTEVHVADRHFVPSSSSSADSPNSRIQPHMGISRIVSHSKYVEFVDGSQAEVDAIIWSVTSYKYLSKDCI